MPVLREKGQGLGAAQRVDESQLAHELRGHRDGAPVFVPALQGGDPDLGDVEVHVAGAQREGFGDTASGVGKHEREGLHFGPCVGAGRDEETLALLGGQVFATAGVEEGGRNAGHAGQRRRNGEGGRGPGPAWAPGVVGRFGPNGPNVHAWEVQNSVGSTLMVSRGSA